MNFQSILFFEINLILIIALLFLLTTLLPLSRMENTKKWRMIGNISWLLCTISAIFMTIFSFIGILVVIESPATRDGKLTMAAFSLGLILTSMILGPSISTYWATSSKFYKKFTNKFSFAISMVMIQTLSLAVSVLLLSVLNTLMD